MANAAMSKFDPELHPDNLYDAFEEFIESFKYEYVVIAKEPPAGTEGEAKAAWILQDKRKQFLGRYSSRNLQRDFEDIVPGNERDTIAFNIMVDRLKERYKPSKNRTITNYEFHKLKQRKDESFDMFANRVKHEANGCEFKCASATCNVNETLIRDRIIIGIHNEEIRKNALKEQWSLNDLITNGRRIEAAEKGADKIAAGQEEFSVYRSQKPGRYSKKRELKQNFEKRQYDISRQKKKFECYRCMAKRCKGEKACPAFNKECFDCGKVGHFKGAKACKYVKQKRDTRRINDEENSSEDSTSPAESSSSDESTNEGKTIQRLKRISVRRIGRARKTKKQFLKQNSKYKIKVIINEKEIDAFADTGADINIMSLKTAKNLNLPLTKTKAKIRPYGSNSLKCQGYYIGTVMHEEAVTNLKIYVIDKDVETLLSGEACEDLGVIKFTAPKHNADEIRRLMIKDEYKRELLKKHPKLFNGVGTLKEYEVELHIDKNVKPVIAQNRPIPFHLRSKFNSEIKRMEEEMIIEEHHGPTEWVSNVVLVPKPDGGVRVTVDMREANNAIKDTHIPIPRPEDIKSRLSGSNFFSKLDFKQAFHQLEIKPESRGITTFYAGDRLMRYRKLTMGTKPASGELTKALRPIFASLPNCHVIHDDVIIGTETGEQHDAILEKALLTIENKGLTLNIDKCIFKKDHVPFWGMIVTKNGILPDPSKVHTLKNASRPQNKSEVRSFLCMVQSNSDFLPLLSQNTTHLRELIKKHTRFHWDNNCEKEFKMLKELFSEDCLLRFFNPSDRTFIYVDAHQTGLSAILKQGKTEEQAKPVAFASRATTPVERRYPQLDLEALSIDFGLRRFRQYIVGAPVEIITDHKPLLSIFHNSRKGSSRTDRIKLRHQDIDFHVTWKNGEENPADFLSRHATPLNKVPKEWRHETEEFEKTIWLLQFSPYTQALSMDKIIAETKTDPVLKQLASFIHKGYIPKHHKQLKPYRKFVDDLTISDEGFLLKKDRIILPQSLWKTAIEKGHQGGHPGIVNLKRRIRTHFYFPNMNKLAEREIKSCKSCQLFTSKTTKEPISPQPFTDGPWEEVSVDLFGPMPNKKHIIVVQDNFSRFPAAKIVPSTAAKPVLSALGDIYNNYGNPECHRSDNGPPFNSEEFSKFSRERGITHKKFICTTHKGIQWKP